VTDLRGELAAYGARLGIVEPLFHKMASNIADLESLQADLRLRKDYATADRLRSVIESMRDAASFAFPLRYK
jgi:hypothetical protein